MDIIIGQQNPNHHNKSKILSLAAATSIHNWDGRCRHRSPLHYEQALHQWEEIHTMSRMVGGKSRSSDQLVEQED